MPAPQAKSKSERLEARIPASVKAILARAASMQGRSLTDFVVGSATEAAHRVIRESELLALSERDQIAFARAVSRPARPTAAMRLMLRRGNTAPKYGRPMPAAP